ncbi:hypothetical protein [Mesorhizobium abyssinicae]|uniref:hypothetical protein n=1 Tax=Mesorhizobium abyssinicae TaxID=1209958 RepID=UPI003394BB49
MPTIREYSSPDDRLGRVLVDLWLSSYAAPPKSVTLDVDATLDVRMRGKKPLIGLGAFAAAQATSTSMARQRERSYLLVCASIEARLYPQPHGQH